MLTTLALLTVAPTRFLPYRHPVTIWVPPYAVAASKEQLTADFGGTGVKDGITHLALQFWVPSPDGTVKRVGFGQVDDATIGELREWGHANGIRVLLCVYNHNVDKWDWSLARSAFADHRDAFVQSLVAEVDRLGLDGVDVDLEGPGEFKADRTPFLSFMTALSREMKSRRKHLTVDTFSASRWNTPNQSWWPELFPLVNALTSMGYDDSGQNAPEFRSYAAQRKVAGANAAKLQLGVPSDKDAWRDNTAREQLTWIQQDGTMGIGIWDAQLTAAAWRTPEVWRTIAKIRGKR